MIPTPIRVHNKEQPTLTNGHNEKLVELTEPFSAQEENNLRMVKKRFREFWDNFEDLRALGFSLNAGFKQEQSGVVTTDASLGVSRFRLKGYLVDYRHFSGREPTHFYSIVNTLRRRCREVSVTNRLDRAKVDWDGCSALCGWNNDFSVDEVIEAAFKEEIFHTHPKGEHIRVRMDDVAKKFSPDVLWYELASVAYNRMLIIRNIDWMLQPIYQGTQFLRVPSQQ